MMSQRADPGAVDGAVDALGNLAAEDDGIAVALRETCATYGRSGTGPMRDLLATQPYRLAYWRRAAREINYRRFFTISHLVAIRQEREDVFAATHRLVLHLVEQGLVDGIRVDHVDGLLHPGAYLERLQAALAAAAGEAREVVVWVEKILAPDEHLPEAWPVMGTTGYEFLAGTDALSIDVEGWEQIERGYRALVRPRPTDFPTTAHRAKRTILTEHVTGDVTRLARRAMRLAGRLDEPLSVAQIGAALVAVVAALDRYRLYVLDAAPWYDRSGREALEGAFHAVTQEGRVAPSALRLLAWLLLLDPEPIRSASEVDHRVDFARRVGQLAVTAAAKGVEDTALYRYVPLVAVNEVGCEPSATWLFSAVDQFHVANTRRRRASPCGLLSTSTHDTKRSADTRARLAVLSEIPDEWLARVRRWRRLNLPHRSSHGAHRRPDANIEYLFYQTAVGIWPPPAPVGDVGRRLEAYMLKAAREAKIHTSWARPDEAYEDALRRFVRGALDPTGPFVEDLTAFVQRIAGAGLWNALGRTLVHVTVPGVPDIYQGDERWAFRLVDPDNRVAVDLPHHAAMLGELQRRFDAGGAARRALLDEIVTSAEDGRVKLHVICRALAFRRQHENLFADGAYVSLESVGRAESHVVAFARQLEDAWSITVVPRLPFTLTGQRSVPATGDSVWQDTSLRLPEGAAGRTWRSVLTGDIVGERGGDGPMLRVADALGTMPVALLASTG
jgi:(1->4)-alpha-D-glucan 1-alpha-D-glucosylmutase